MTMSDSDNKANSRTWHKQNSHTYTKEWMDASEKKMQIISMALQKAK